MKETVLDLYMKEVNLDLWFFDLPACWQESITGISLAHYDATDDPTDPDYQYFDNAVAEWWDSHSYEAKLAIYERETA